MAKNKEVIKEQPLARNLSAAVRMLVFHNNLWGIGTE
jgi:hypothetical protein